MAKYRQYNPAYNKYFKCRIGTCRGTCRYNLQEMSQLGHSVAKCERCGKNWRVEQDTEKKSCCGKIVVRMTSIEKNVSSAPIIFRETEYKG